MRCVSIARRNYSGRVLGRQTNQRAEILAAAVAATLASESGVKYLELRTDSRFLINCVEKWITGWKANGWRKTNGDPVKNRLELQQLDAVSQQINIRYVSASTVQVLNFVALHLNQSPPWL
jgi:ribonuclease HI